MDDMPNTSKDDLIKALKKEGDKATKHLCTVLAVLEERPVTIEELPKDIQKWWKHHSKKDERRAAKEALEKQIETLKKQLDAIED
jgi:cell division protein FtsB